MTVRFAAGDVGAAESTGGAMLDHISSWLSQLGEHLSAAAHAVLAAEPITLATLVVVLTFRWWGG